MPVSTNPEKPVKREPNCKPGDPVDAKGLVHAWHNIGWVEELKTDAVYKCDRCGQMNID